MNPSNARDLRCKKTGGAQIPATLSIRRYFPHKHIYFIHKHTPLTIMVYFSSKCSMSDHVILSCVSRRTQWSVEEPWLSPRLLWQHCSALLWCCSLGDQSWPRLSIHSLTWIGLARHTNNTTENNTFAPQEIVSNSSSAPTNSLVLNYLYPRYIFERTDNR